MNDRSFLLKENFQQHRRQYGSVQNGNINLTEIERRNHNSSNNNRVGAMSFQDLQGGGVAYKSNKPAYQAGSGQNFEAPEAEGIRMEIQNIQKEVLRIKKQVVTLGTTQDSPTLRQNLRKNLREVTLRAQKTNTRIQDLGRFRPGMNRREQELSRRQSEKLAHDFLILYNDFKALQTEAKKKELQSEVRSTSSSGDHGQPLLSLDEDENRQLLHNQLRQQQEYNDIEQNLEFHQAVAYDRQDSILDIEHDIGLVNDIFKDLATLVDDQGMVIDDIEGNIVSALSQAKDGTEEVRKAATYQKKARNKLCIFLICLLIAAAIIVVVLTTSL